MQHAAPKQSFAAVELFCRLDGIVYPSPDKLLADDARALTKILRSRAWLSHVATRHSTGTHPDSAQLSVVRREDLAGEH